MINIENAKKIYKALIDSGVNNNLLPLLMYQIAHETGGFNSKVLQSDNNASGIMFINAPKQKNAIKGRAYPKNESNSAHYAKFNTLKDWAIDYLRILGKTPQNASSLTDFAIKLKNRGYYTASTNLYANALISWKKQFDKINLFQDIQKEKNNIILPISIILITFAFILLK